MDGLVSGAGPSANKATKHRPRTCALSRAVTVSDHGNAQRRRNAESESPEHVDQRKCRQGEAAGERQPARALLLVLSVGLLTARANTGQTHLHAQLAQLSAHLSDTDNLLRMTSVQAEAMRGLGSWHGGL